MHTYVLQIKPGYETYAVREIRRSGYEAYAPARIALHRRGGSWWETEHLVFSGYAFVRTLLADGDYQKIMQCAGVIRFLGCGAPEPLQPHEEQYIDLLNNGGELIKPSEIQIRPDGSMVYVAGLICSFSSREIRHDQRQRRATVPITIAGKQYHITLAVRYHQQTDLMTDAGVDSSPSAGQDCMIPAI